MHTHLFNNQNCTFAYRDIFLCGGHLQHNTDISLFFQQTARRWADSDIALIPILYSVFIHLSMAIELEAKSIVP